MRDDLAEHMEQMLRSFRQARDQLADITNNASQAQAWARSRDNLISVTMTAGAGITELTISPRAMQRYDSGILATTIMAVIGEANTQLQAVVAQQYRNALGGDFDPAALAGDPQATADTIKNMARQWREY